LIGEYQDNASTATPIDDWLVQQETVWLGDIPVGVITKPTATSEIQVHYIHTDHLNTHEPETGRYISPDPNE